MWRLRIDLEYDGTEFAGWQRQPRLRTVQGELECALSRVYQRAITVVGAGRTDAGVHALGQVAHVDLPGSPSEVQRLLEALNGLTCDALVVHAVRPVAQSFHARRSARWRVYRYRVARRRLACGRQYVWTLTQPLRLSRLQACAESLPGTNAFSSFCVAKSAPKGTECTVHEARWRRRGVEYWFEIRANRFVHGMVRSLVGTMVQFGMGKGTSGEFAELLESPRRSGAGPTAPACGLFLLGVGYDDDSKPEGV